jgi:hypothetical protein
LPARALSGSGFVLREPWEWIAVLLVLLSLGGLAIARIGVQRRRTLHHERLRQQLRGWVDAEPIQVEQL